MEKNQKIYCDVCSCEFNDKSKQTCNLEQIKVCACKDCNTGNAKDESMCGSYECKH